MSDRDLVALATQEVVKVGLISAADVVDGCVVRQPKAYPVYDDAYRDHMAMIRRDLEQSYPSLHLIGRNGMHKYNTQDHAMMTAMLTVRNILAGERIYDIWQVNEDAEYHEAGASALRQRFASERLVPLKAQNPGGVAHRRVPARRVARNAGNSPSCRWESNSRDARTAAVRQQCIMMYSSPDTEAKIKYRLDGR